MSSDKKQATEWHAQSIEAVLKQLDSSEHGLSTTEVKNRLKRFGKNRLPTTHPDSAFAIFLRQFQSPLIYILMVAAVIMFFMREVIDGSIIIAVLFFNAIVGAIQEGKAQNTLLALKRFTETQATVVRENQELIIKDSDVVPGDIIVLFEGEKVPADARIILEHNLRVDEAAMTGESEPVHKTADVVKSSHADNRPQNMVLKGTHVVAGSGKAVVVATGLETMIGKIAREISLIDTEIPLKANVRYFARLVMIGVATLGIIILIIGMTMRLPIEDTIGTIIALAVSIIPEGLPIVLTLILATGVWRMSKRNALIKKLQAVETLGQARVIAVDKTGTITKNELVVQKVFIGGKLFSVGGVGYDPIGDIMLDDTIVEPANHPDILLAGKIAAFCADARVMLAKETKQWKVSGDPTEAAMLVFAEKLGIKKHIIEQESPVLADLPFDYKLKYHAMIHGGERAMMTVVGAPEVVMSLATMVWRDGKRHRLSKKDKTIFEEQHLALSRQGLRVIAFAESERVPKTLVPESIHGLTLVGLLGMKDALRAEVAQAMTQAHDAGIKVVMITGDHKATAEAIAKEAGIFQDGDTVLTGENIDSYTDAELSKHLGGVSVFARVNPTHKLKIINAYRSRGEVIAMTGDGVNDAPSLVAADLGVAMGRIGTEVAKEASDIVLLDDNFGSIVSAIEEGRSIYKTLKKVITYLLAGSWSQILTILGSFALGFPLPILPAQIIWLNFVTDGFLDVSLAMEPKEDGLLKQQFKRPAKYLVDWTMVQRIIIMAVPRAIGALVLFAMYYQIDITKAWTVVLTTLAVGHWFNAWNCRSEDQSIFTMKFFSNKFLIGATALIIVLQVCAIYFPFMQTLLRTTSLSLMDWLIIVPIGASIILVEEIRKYFVHRARPVSYAEIHT